MENVVQLWDVYETSPTASQLKKNTEEVRLQKEVERLNSTIASLEAERDRYLQTINELKQRPKPRTITIRRKNRDKQIAMPLDKTERKLIAIGKVAEDLHAIGVKSMITANYSITSLDGRHGAQLICAAQQIHNIINGR